MLVGFVCFIIFLFTVYQLSKEDFLFIRKGVSMDNIFDLVFMALPFALLTSRLFYIMFHPSWHYLNPLIFFVIPYFPGLSLVGGIIGAWIFIVFYTKNKKISSSRLLDMLSLSFLLAFSIGVILEAITVILHNRVIGVEEIGQGLVGAMIYISLLFQFMKGSWTEGSMSSFIVSICCLLSSMNSATLFALHQPVAIGSIITTGIVFLVFMILFFQKQKIIQKLIGK